MTRYGRLLEDGTSVQLEFEDPNASSSGCRSRTLSAKTVMVAVGVLCVAGVVAMAVGFAVASSSGGAGRYDVF